MWHHVKEWLRDRTINLLLDLLCQVVPDKGAYYELIIEPVDEGASMLATLREREKPR